MLCKTLILFLQMSNPQVKKLYCQFGKKVLPGLFLGYVLIADLEELETMDASEIYSKRLNAKEVIFPKQGEIYFSNRRWTNQNSRRRSGTENIHLDTAATKSRRGSHLTFLENQKGLFHNPTTHFRLPVKLCTIFWSHVVGSFIYRHHVEPRVKLYSPREESFPIPLKYIDVTRTTHTNLDVKLEKRIDDYWNIDGSRDLSDPWTGFTQFTLLDEKAPDGYTWSRGEINEKAAYIQARSSMARVMEVNGKERQAEGKAKMG